MYKLVSFFVIIIIFLIQQQGEPNQMDSKSFYSFEVNDINGNPVSLSDYKGKVLLVVNTASKCGFTKQYASLEKLYTNLKEQGFEILAFPANNFLNQEPGTNDEIKEFCSLNYNVTFPIFAKINVKGKKIHPLYEFLTTYPEFEGKISWNFNKFLIDQNGTVVARFGSRVDPLDDKVVDKIKQTLQIK